jgi:uncharacterized protein
MTLEYGESWGYSHARRLLALIECIGAGMVYDKEALTIAVYLHDWGGYPRYAQPGVDHALRSRHIAKSEILPQMNLTEDAIAIILEAIEYHDYRDQRPVHSVEALLLREADYLDFLGIIGLAREFSWAPHNLQLAVDRMHSRRELIENRFTIPAAQDIAKERLAMMDQFIHLLEKESFGFL